MYIFPKKPDFYTLGVVFCIIFFIASYSLKMLQIAKDPNTLGNVRWELAICMFVVSTVVYFKLWKSTESSGRVLHLTATLPFAMLAVLLVRSLMLDGADIGIEYFLFKLRWELLLDSKVSVEQAIQGDSFKRINTRYFVNYYVSTYFYVFENIFFA